VVLSDDDDEEDASSDGGDSGSDYEGGSWGVGAGWVDGLTAVCWFLSISCLLIGTCMPNDLDCPPIIAD